MIWIQHYIQFLFYFVRFDHRIVWHWTCIFSVSGFIRFIFLNIYSVFLLLFLSTCATVRGTFLSMAAGDFIFPIFFSTSSSADMAPSCPDILFSLSSSVGSKSNRKETEIYPQRNKTLFCRFFFSLASAVTVDTVLNLPDETTPLKLPTGKIQKKPVKLDKTR